MVDSDKSSREVAAWVFQATPSLFAVDEYFSRHNLVYWGTPHLSKAMELGATAYFKRSGPGGGIVAEGTITELPTEPEKVLSPSHLGDDLWVSPMKLDKLVVGITLSDVRLTVDDGMLPTKQLESLPELASHTLVKSRNRTVFWLDPEQASSVRRAWRGETPVVPNPGEHCVEGRRQLTEHYRIERCSKLVDDKKEAFRALHGKLFCEVCREDHVEKYGPAWSERVIEAHHLKPLASLLAPCKTELTDLILVCRNCHGLVHQDENATNNLEMLRRQFAAS